MSSRAAASRKRLNHPGEDKRPRSSGGFFSRSKTATMASPQIDLTSLFPNSNITHITNHDSAQTSPYHSEISLAAECHGARRNSFSAESSRNTAFPSSSSPPSTKNVSLGGSGQGSTYPSPPHEGFQPILLTPNSSCGNLPPESQQQGVSYIEASYQPPPPVRSMPINGQRALPRLPGENVDSSSLDTLSDFPAPPTYPPPLPSTAPFVLPSPSTTPPRSSVLLQSSPRNSSPTPTYSSHQVPYTPVQDGQPPLQASIHNSPHGHTVYPRHNETTSYPSPSSSNSTGLTLSPFRAPDALAAESISSLSLSVSSSNEFEKKPWYRDPGGNQSSAPSSPARVTFQTSAHSTSPSIRLSESVSESSDYSGKSSASEGPQNTTTKFVFPGSRSVARPKAPKKFSNLAIKIKASNMPSPPLSDLGADAPVLHITRNGRSPITADPRNTISDMASTGSNDNDPDISRVRKQSATSSNPSTSPSSGSSDSGPTPSGYLYPVGRSRAQPSKITRKRPEKSSTDEGDREERTRFMGMLLKKKRKSKASDSSSDSNTISSGTEPESNHTRPPSDGTQNLSHEENQVTIQESQVKVNRIKSRIGNYPLDPYDSVLLDNDRHTGELLVRLNPTGSPSFHNYGNTPPTSVLDLGCGQGHWVVDAAIAWKGYGTQVTGYDMVDISKGLIPWATEQGIMENIQFVQGNFLKQRLPFSDESFDLVRMSCLALSITSDSWIFILQEVCRVLMVGGRLELIDDLIFFPYGKASSALDVCTSASNSPIESVAPHLDITIPSASFTTFSIYDGETTNPGLGLSMDDPEAEGFYDLYGVEEEEEDVDVDDDTETVNGFNMNSRPATSQDPKSTPLTREAEVYAGISSRSWDRACATSRDLEALFEHMLLHKFGINKDPSDFVLDLMKQTFGHAREIKNMHLTLAPPESGDDEDDGFRGRQNGAFNGRGDFRSSAVLRRQSMGLSRSSGLVLWPSTYLPMDKSEIEIHASKHLRLLLSCKNLLMEHAIEATDDEDINEESVLEALWEYEGFLRHRFNPPPPSTSSGSDEGDHESDAVSIHGSIAESVSSDNREAMWEIQSEFRQHFSWQRSSSRDRPSTPSTPKAQNNMPTNPAFSETIPSRSAPSSSALASLSRRDTISSVASPLYSQNEMTHVRTFRIYEAIKVDETIFGTAM